MALVAVVMCAAFAGAACGGSQYVRVRGKNACGVGSASNEVAITVR